MTQTPALSQSQSPQIPIPLLQNFNIAYAQFKGLVHAQVNRILYNTYSNRYRMDIEDVEQEIWTKVYKGLIQGTSIDSWPSYLTCVCKSVCIDLIRKTRKISYVEIKEGTMLGDGTSTGTGTAIDIDSSLEVVYSLLDLKATKTLNKFNTGKRISSKERKYLERRLREACMSLNI